VPVGVSVRVCARARVFACACVGAAAVARVRHMCETKNKKCTNHFLETYIAK